MEQSSDSGRQTCLLGAFLWVPEFMNLWETSQQKYLSPTGRHRRQKGFPLTKEDIYEILIHAI
jgi:hypothetical protein